MFALIAASIVTLERTRPAHGTPTGPFTDDDRRQLALYCDDPAKRQLIEDAVNSCGWRYWAWCIDDGRLFAWLEANWTEDLDPQQRLDRMPRDLYEDARAVVTQSINEVMAASGEASA